MICPKCGKKMHLKNNTLNNIQFLGCSSFPHCRYTTEYIEPKDVISAITKVIDKYETDIRKKLKIPNFISVTHDFETEIKEAATCSRISQREFKFNWNTELKRSTLAKIVIELAHEYRHVYQMYFDTIDTEYDTTINWKLRLHEIDANEFAYQYLDDIIIG